MEDKRDMVGEDENTKDAIPDAKIQVDEKVDITAAFILEDGAVKSQRIMERSRVQMVKPKV